MKIKVVKKGSPKQEIPNESCPWMITDVQDKTK
jgi:hypothetical protein